MAAPCNILAWSGWGQAGGLKTTDDIFLYFQKYWDPDPANGGNDAYDALEWFFSGAAASGDYPGGGGFFPAVDFPSYCNVDMRDPYVGLCPAYMADHPDSIQKLLDAGFAAGLQLKSSDGSHVITAWGYSVDPGNPDLMAGIFLTDSDDDKRKTAPPNRLYHRDVQYIDGVWHIVPANSTDRKYWIKYVYGLQQRR